MKAIVRLICRPATATGFGLAGVPALEVAPGAEAASPVETMLRAGDAGVLLIEEAVYDALSSDLRQRLERSVTPVVVPFPGPAWTDRVPAEERVVELLRRAIGYRVRLA